VCGRTARTVRRATKHVTVMLERRRKEVMKHASRDRGAPRRPGGQLGRRGTMRENSSEARGDKRQRAGPHPDPEAAGLNSGMATRGSFRSMRPQREHAANRWGWRESWRSSVYEPTEPKGQQAKPFLLAGCKHTGHGGGAESTLWASRSSLTRSVEDSHVNVGSAETCPLRTGLPAVEAVSAWRRGCSTLSVGELRTRLGEKLSHREGPQLTVEAGDQRNVLETYGRYQSDST
jgi:hypothetical protein